jgi:hypothetical protein
MRPRCCVIPPGHSFHDEAGAFPALPALSDFDGGPIKVDNVLHDAILAHAGRSIQ